MSLSILIACATQPPSPGQFLSRYPDEDWNDILEIPNPEKWQDVGLSGFWIDEITPSAHAMGRIRHFYDGNIAKIISVSGPTHSDLEFDALLVFFETIITLTGGVVVSADEEFIYCDSRKLQEGACSSNASPLQPDPILEWAKEHTPEGTTLEEVIESSLANDEEAQAKLMAWARMYRKYCTAEDRTMHFQRRSSLGSNLLESLTECPVKKWDSLLKALLELQFSEGLAKLRTLMARPGLSLRQLQYLEDLERLAKVEGQLRIENDWSKI
jgi:hypothetical protein